MNYNHPLFELKDALFRYNDIKFFLKRDDKIHGLVSGNKFRKLKYNIIQAKHQHKSILLTFGGAFSNHIHAVAAAGKISNFKTIGLIRGEKNLSYNKTLSFAEEQGMQLEFINRTDYRNKMNPTFLKEIEEKYNYPYIIPEGGTNSLAIKGCSEVIDEIDIPFDYICTAVGTGGTVSGLIAGCDNKHQVLGFSALKGGDFLNKDINELLLAYNGQSYDNWNIQTDYHFGGYAKIKPELIKFINDFKKEHDIQLEPIYTGKMMYGIYDLIQKGFFKPGSTIIALHTGGLQGIDGINQRYGNVINLE
jgi:1-aminocyclopropane-1-carboxylate deaminase/D-cysteine desulfhydrase-like pyridoxal-dependent ACC family enzyme